MEEQTCVKFGFFGSGQKNSAADYSAISIFIRPLFSYICGRAFDLLGPLILYTVHCTVCISDQEQSVIRSKGSGRLGRFVLAVRLYAQFPLQSSGVAGYSILILFMQVFFILRKCESK